MGKVILRLQNPAGLILSLQSVRPTEKHEGGMSAKRAASETTGSLKEQMEGPSETPGVQFFSQAPRASSQLVGENPPLAGSPF